MSRQTALAGEKYAGYLCDRCDQPIGDDGIVILSETRPPLVWECWCVACRKPS